MTMDTQIDERGASRSVADRDAEMLQRAIALTMAHWRVVVALSVFTGSELADWSMAALSALPTSVTMVRDVHFPRHLSRVLTAPQ